MLRLFNKKNINSLSFAIMLSIGPICWTLPAIDGASVFVAAFILILYFVGKNNLVQKNVLPLIIICLLFFLQSFLLLSKNELLVKYFIEFLAMGILGMYVSQINFNHHLTITLSCYISILLIPTILNIDFLGAESQGLWMGFSYGTLRFIIALLFSLIYIKYNIKANKLLFTASLIFYIIFYSLYASRGAVLAIVVFVISALYIRLSHLSLAIKINFLILVIFSLAFFEPLISFIQSTLSTFGIDIYAIDKLMRMMSESDVSNGRNDIINQGLTMGFDSPILGNGIASYEIKYNRGWVHNIFVQLFLEGGILLFLPFGYYIIYSIKYILSTDNPNNERLFLALLLAGGLIELLFSSYLWRSQVFWLYIGYTIRLKKQNKSIIYATK